MVPPGWRTHDEKDPHRASQAPWRAAVRVAASTVQRLARTVLKAWV